MLDINSYFYKGNLLKIELQALVMLTVGRNLECIVKEKDGEH